MNILDRAGVHNGYKSWQDMCDSVKKKKIKFTIPNYLNYNRVAVSHELILAALKASGLQVTVEEDEIFINKK